MVSGSYTHAREPAPPGTELKAQLRRRHITMISMGGVIGGGLFVGSGAVIGKAGPGAVISYLLCGLLVILIIRMLGEMASARPTLGSFAEYARTSIGEWAGFSTGWLYAYQWLTAIAMESIAAARIARDWLPSVPLWAIALSFLTLLTLSNLFSARSFGEVESWLSSVKVAAIIVFIVLGIAALCGVGLHTPNGAPDLLAHGAILPVGWGPVLGTIPIVIVAFFGSEVATIAAAESTEPRQGVARATNSVILRIMLFYICSLVLIVTLVPWSNSGLMASPFASALSGIGIPAASTVMNVVILTAILSCLNSGIYASSRMVFALASRGDAPPVLMKTTRRGVPSRAVLLVTSGGYLAVIMAVIWPTQVFFFLINSAGAIALIVYLLIAISHLRMRRVLDREVPQAQRVKMWLYPFLNYVAIVAMAAVFLSMAFVKETRVQLAFTLVSLTVVLVLYRAKVIRQRRRAGEAPLVMPMPQVLVNAASSAAAAVTPAEPVSGMILSEEGAVV